MSRSDGTASSDAIERFTFRWVNFERICGPPAEAWTVCHPAMKRTGMVSDSGGLNHRAAGCPPAQDDQTQDLHPFA